ncbi:Hsp33 family molecular chaperone HslO [Peptoniphilus sp. oral taxon 386]|uniref:Hsp33 family molecular chaperone HslO n=1 Tax=Peptoniphilus sp. oral taxon 386 TaxID=652713 RepID=UPI0001DAA41F|nr:Hsp33 family molecular chaperone HslO [Peptoniphilus sp. oral taxon 386]EFI41325.1 chaperonin HslO [Peptoniphilus sp. oral taxon 386 str. F0131]
MDYLVRAVDIDGNIKISAVITTDIVEKARVTHSLSKTASAALGRTLSVGVIMAEALKNENDSITINIKGDGDIGRIVVSGKNDGNIKGYVENPLADTDSRVIDNKLDVGKLVGNGTLTVVTDLGLKEPYVGQVQLVSGEIAEDFANYFYTSDQVPSVVSLGVLVDTDYTIKAAGGFVLQLLPGAEEEIISKIEKNLKDLDSVTSMISDGYLPEDIIKRVLSGFEVKILSVKKVYYNCDCSREKVEDAIISLGKKELEEILKTDKKAEMKCYFCNKTYELNEAELKSLVDKID